MAQANSVQREPSMEEILASIRRIIEDSDTGGKDFDDSAAAVSAEIEPELQAAMEIEAFREELVADQPEQPGSLAQIQAEIAREPRFEQSPVREAWAQPAPAMRRVEPEVREPEQRQVHREDDFEDAESAAANDEAPVLAENENPKPAILSDHAGRQVAASFGELSDAFAVNRRKSYDEMAEDMMRPMLQDWLDNNLPLLVEKLVREEIERVARGGAR